MNRPLKFRAWDGKRMLENPRFEFFNHGKDGPPVVMADENENVEVMQFTGLTDKNGKEIYEGDMVVLKNFPEEIDADHMQGTLVVWFNPEAVRFEGKHHVPLDWSGTESMEVIGNIYENAEIIEKEV